MVRFDPTSVRHCIYTKPLEGNIARSHLVECAEQLGVQFPDSELLHF